MYILVVDDAVRIDISHIGRTMAKIKQMVKKHAAKDRKNADVDEQHGNDAQRPLHLRQICIKNDGGIDLCIKIIIPSHFLSFWSAFLRTNHVIIELTITTRIRTIEEWIIQLRMNDFLSCRWHFLCFA